MTDKTLKENIQNLLDHYNKKEFTFAEEIAKDMIRQFPKATISWKVLSAIYAEEGKIKKSIEASYKAINLNNLDLEAHNNLFLVLLKFKKFEEAIECCEKILSIKPDYVDGYINFGKTLSFLGRLNEAKDKFKKAINIQPDLNSAYFNLANTNFALNEFEEAELNYNKSIKLNPKSEESYSNLGALFLKLKRFNEAEKSFKKSLQLKPDYTDALFNLAGLYQKINRLNDSEFYYNKLIKLNKNYTKAYSQLGIIFQKQNKLNEAEEVYNRVLKIKPDYLEVIKNLDVLHTQKKLLKFIKKRRNKESSFQKNPFITKKNVEKNLIENLYEIETTKLDYVDPGYLRYGNGSASNYKLFDNSNPIIKNLSYEINKIIIDAVGSKIFIMESFYNIFKSGSGIVKHNHLQTFDYNNNLENNKFSLVYYLSVGDQNTNDPGYLKLYDPEIEILPTEGMIIIFPASKMHKATYSGKKDRVMIGVNFYVVD